MAHFEPESSQWQSQAEARNTGMIDRRGAFVLLKSGLPLVQMVPAPMAEMTITIAPSQVVI
jgi:hypothetical protein